MRAIVFSLILVLASAGFGWTSVPPENRHWAFQPIQAPIIPRIASPRWNANPVDALVAAQHLALGLKPVEKASKLTLIRRATFDLIGLPPTPEEIDCFVRDESPDAFEHLVDRLLSSPHYGERWGRHWLDLARYADTAGDGADYPIPEAFKYRNYVIDAFNDDKPYDEFVREQIAGDLLPYGDEEERWEQIIATGYIAISRRIGVSPLGLRHITIEDTLDNLGKTFLGLTLGCARCHDHKFDPIPTEDYYALYGIFDSSVYPHPGEEHHPYRKDFIYRIGEEAANNLLRDHRETLAKVRQEERRQFEVYRSFQNRRVTDPNLSRESTWADLLKIREKLRGVVEQFPDLEIAYAMRDGEARDAHVMKAGDPGAGARGALVRRGFLSVLGGPKMPEDAEGSGRLELADWILDERNPLTARVMVNRIWHHHFGRGLVSTTSDFGVRGSAPTHPELLDFLASYFRAYGWSVKQMHRLIMLSRVYQLASDGSSDLESNTAVDPENRFLWRQNRRRLDAEQSRDATLMFGNELDLSVGGRHPFPHHLTYFYRQHDPFQESYPTMRRAVYQLQQRLQKDPYLELYDGPDGNLHFGARLTTTTTLQALHAMNSEFIHARGEAIARRLMREAEGSAGRVQWAYLNIFNRQPTGGEIRRAMAFIDQQQSRLNDICGNPDEAQAQAWASYVRGMIASNEFMFVD